MVMLSPTQQQNVSNIDRRQMLDEGTRALNEGRYDEWRAEQSRKYGVVEPGDYTVSGGGTSKVSKARTGQQYLTKEQQEELRVLSQQEIQQSEQSYYKPQTASQSVQPQQTFQPSTPTAQARVQSTSGYSGYYGDEQPRKDSGAIQVGATLDGQEPVKEKLSLKDRYNAVLGVIGDVKKKGEEGRLERKKEKEKIYDKINPYLSKITTALSKSKEEVEDYEKTAFLTLQKEKASETGVYAGKDDYNSGDVKDTINYDNSLYLDTKAMYKAISEGKTYEEYKKIDKFDNTVSKIPIIGEPIVDVKQRVEGAVLRYGEEKSKLFRENPAQWTQEATTSAVTTGLTMGTYSVGSGVATSIAPTSKGFIAGTLRLTTFVATGIGEMKALDVIYDKSGDASRTSEQQELLNKVGDEQVRQTILEARDVRQKEGREPIKKAWSNVISETSELDFKGMGKESINLAKELTIGGFKEFAPRMVNQESFEKTIKSRTPEGIDKDAYLEAVKSQSKPEDVATSFKYLVGESLANAYGGVTTGIYYTGKKTLGKFLKTKGGAGATEGVLTAKAYMDTYTPDMQFLPGFEKVEGTPAFDSRVSEDYTNEVIELTRKEYSEKGYDKPEFVKKLSEEKKNVVLVIKDEFDINNDGKIDSTLITKQEFYATADKIPESKRFIMGKGLVYGLSAGLGVVSATGFGVVEYVLNKIPVIGGNLALGTGYLFDNPFEMGGDVTPVIAQSTIITTNPSNLVDFTSSFNSNKGTQTKEVTFQGSKTQEFTYQPQENINYQPAPQKSTEQFNQPIRTPQEEIVPNYNVNNINFNDNVQSPNINTETNTSFDIVSDTVEVIEPQPQPEQVFNIDTNNSNNNVNINNNTNNNTNMNTNTSTPKFFFPWLPSGGQPSTYNFDKGLSLRKGGFGYTPSFDALILGIKSTKKPIGLGMSNIFSGQETRPIIVEQSMNSLLAGKRPSGGRKKKKIQTLSLTPKRPRGRPKKQKRKYVRKDDYVNGIRIPKIRL